MHFQFSPGLIKYLVLYRHKSIKLFIWYDRECSRQRKIYNRLRNKCNNSKSDSDKRDRGDAKKTYVQLCKLKSTAYNNDQTNTLMREKFTNPKSYWKHIKPRIVENNTYVAPEVFAEHFSQLDVSHSTGMSFSDDNYAVHNEILDRKFTLQEIDSAIKNLKSGKATGSDDIRNEYISYENKQLRPALKLLFNEIYDTGIYPAQWCSGIIVPIYKKGNREDPSNYRGITLTSAMSKLFTHMLNQRINDWSEESGILSQAQFAYKKGYNTTDAIFVLNTTLSFCIETFKHSCCGFIDFSKAFDTIDREMLYGKLKRCNISSKFLNLIKNMYGQLKCQVRTAEGISECFSQDNGVLQGESLSPTLFAAYINELESIMNVTEGMGVNINGVKVSVLMYADDLVLLSQTKDGLQRGINVLHRFCTENNLTVNTSKSKLMYVSKRRPAKLPVIEYNCQPLQWVDSFKYLGVTISATNNFTKGMKTICQQASKSQTVIDMHVLKHPTVSLNHIFQLFDTLIKPILTYGCAVWGTGNYTDIETYHNKFLKRTLRVKSSTNTCLLYMETGRFPLSVFINMCIVKFWLKILKTCDEKLISAAYAEMMQDPDKYAWVKYTRDLLCSHGFGNVWRDQSVMNEK